MAKMLEVRIFDANDFQRKHFVAQNKMAALAGIALFALERWNALILGKPPTTVKKVVDKFFPSQGYKYTQEELEVLTAAKGSQDFLKRHRIAQTAADKV